MTMRHIAGSVCLLAVLGACTRSPTPASEAQPPHLQQAKPLDPATTAGRMVAIRGAAMMGDQEAVRGQMNAMTDDMRRHMRIPDPARKIPPEPAREAVKAVVGVTTAAWVDQENLLVMVDGAQYRTNGMIDQLCMRLEPLGDTLWVNVHLQNRRARSGEELEIISRNCQLPSGESAFMRQQRQLNVVPPNVRAAHQADQTRAQAGRARNPTEDRGNSEALRNIPEM